ncbi:MAG TPA: M10 family metallopeptidase C-terminal domain-containing protein [Allosphingosinicella sp.]|jgi:Ca2+-binding RTX toxin-like protein
MQAKSWYRRRLYGPGAGVDTADYSLETGGGGITVNLSGGLVYIFDGPTLQPGQARDSHGNVDTLANLENFRTGSGDDYVIGNAVANRIETGGGRDILVGGAGADYLAGGDGDDQYYVYAADSATFEDVIVEVAGGGWDQIRTTLSSFSLAGLPEVESLFGIADTAFSLTGNDLDNYIIGLGGDDTLEGGLGDDKLEGNGGIDTMRGGLGDDEYVVNEIGDVVIENAGEGTDRIWTTLATYSLVGTNIEILSAASQVAHDFRGNAFDNRISGAGGNDFIRLQDGGDDTAQGGQGNDVFLFGATMNGADEVDGGPGTDQVAIQGDYWGAKALSLGSNFVSVENIAILPGDDTRFGDPGTAFYDYSLRILDSAVAAGVQLTVDANRLRAGEDFTFNGSAETDGSFFVYGGGGVDRLIGGAKNDVFIFGGQGQFGSGDFVIGGGGIDQLALRGNYTITFGASQLVGVEQIGMVSAQDTRYGVLGSSYSYDLTMVDGNVDSIQMTVDASPLRAGETLKFDGSAEDDGSFRVFGGRDNDTIVGSRNGDILAGNGGSDTLTGGDGSDVFRYYSTTDSTVAAPDLIRYFVGGADDIDLSRIDANVHVAGDQAFRFIASAAFTGAGESSAGELRSYGESGIWHVEGDVDGDGSADFSIQIILAGPPLITSDFLL